MFYNFLLEIIKSIIKNFAKCFFYTYFIIKKLLIRKFFYEPFTRILYFADEIVYAVRYNIAENSYSKINTIYEFPQLLKYEVNCSGFINYLLESQYPEALQEIKEYIVKNDDRKGYKNGLPRCLQYYRFFKDKSPKKYWEVILDARRAQKGDLVLFCDNTEQVTKFGQHIMLIASKPIIHRESRITCSIYDSTGKGHGGDDTRSRDGNNGVGMGIIGLNISPIGAVTQMQWDLIDESTIHKNVVIARVKIA